MLRPSALFFLPNTTTLLARSAINLLKRANQDQIEEAIRTLANRNLAAPAVMRYLEQNVHIAEILERLAGNWNEETVKVFARAMQMEPGKLDVMDLIVAIAILNEPDLESELRSENTSDATSTDLLQNRRITWQYPPAGTPLSPPYVVLVAVEQVDTSAADSEIQAILGELVEYKGFKIPRRMTAVLPKVFPYLNVPSKEAPLLDKSLNIGVVKDLIGKPLDSTPIPARNPVKGLDAPDGIKEAAAGAAGHVMREVRRIANIAPHASRVIGG